MDAISRCRPVQPMRPRGAILEAFDAFSFEARHLFAHRPRAHACGSGNGLRRLPVENQSENVLSTERCQTGILMDVHPVLRGITEVRNLSFLAQGRMDNLLKTHN